MPCYSDYITIDSTTPSRSGLYIVNLPGVEISQLELLTKEDQADYEEFWAMIYKRAWDNLISDLSHSLQEKFFVDSKLVSRETSEFESGANVSTDLAGVTIEFNLPRYARLHIISVDVISEANYSSPEVTIDVYQDDENGDLLSTTSQEVTTGRNTIFIDQDYEVNKVFVAYDPSLYSFRSTENKRYTTPYISWDCDSCRFDCGGYEGTVEQINSGGLNVKYNVYCSVEKFACENINLFKQAFYYRLGLELIIERRFGNKLNRYMTMTLERAEELTNWYNTQFLENLNRAVRSQNMSEDPYCFKCKELVSARSQTP
jgi:hypothetical protein